MDGVPIRGVLWLRHIVDGLANTNDMAHAKSDIAIHVRALTIGGFDDWAIPTRNQQEMQYRAFKHTVGNNQSYLDGYNPDSIPAGALYTKNSPLRTTCAAFGTPCPHD